ncbi:MAG TPA: phosphatase PAP2 family protein [Polyangiaceae bacterium]|nr:phosphatase PAP2 family protein [Polyangiaceae bacterium]
MKLLVVVRRWASWIVVGLTLLLSAAFVELSNEVLEGPADSGLLSGIDRALLRFFVTARRPWLNGIVVELSALGSPVIVALFTFAVGTVLIVLRDRRGAAAIATASLASAVLTLALKAILERPRPEVVPRLVEVSSLSYPSGHSLASAAVYLTAAFVLVRHFARWGERFFVVACTAVLVGVVGVTRVYLGVHYPSDVAAGMLVGTSWALVTAVALRRFDHAAAAPARRAPDEPGAAGERDESGAPRRTDC